MQDKRVVILCTGTQGEPLAALSRIAKKMHKHIKIKKGDTVIISATPIPGNERAVYANINNLLRNDAEVVFKKIAGIHVSGHGSKDEQKVMLNLIKPKFFMPVHGEYNMLIEHKKTAIATGVAPENVIIATNGSKIQLTKSHAGIVGKVNAGVVLVDGLGVGDIGSVVLKDRQQLAEDGVVVVVVTLDKKSAKIVSGPEMITRGFVYSKDAENIIGDAKKAIQAKLRKLEDKNVKEWNAYKQGIKDVAGKFFYDKLKRNPVILPIIIEA